MLLYHWDYFSLHFPHLLLLLFPFLIFSFLMPNVPLIWCCYISYLPILISGSYVLCDLWLIYQYFFVCMDEEITQKLGLIIFCDFLRNLVLGRSKLYWESIVNCLVTYAFQCVLFLPVLSYILPLCVGKFLRLFGTVCILSRVWCGRFPMDLIFLFCCISMPFHLSQPLVEFLTNNHFS